MNKPELYQKTVDILVQAYFNDTLMHVNCEACAVGNLVAANKGIELKRGNHGVRAVGRPYECNTEWFRAIGFGGFVYPERMQIPAVADQINATGYSLEEVGLIEAAFESAYRDNEDIDLEMFNGLMAVIEVLDQIHENTDQAVTTSSKQRFQRA